MIIRFFILIFKRSYKILLLSFFSLLVGGFLFGVVLSFTKSTKDYLVREGKVLSGGDIILRSPYPIDINQEPLQQLIQNGHTLSSGKSFQAVFSSSNSSSTAPASVRVVSNLFPLYGTMLLKDGKEFKQELGGIYVEQAFLEKISGKVGDTVLLAGTPFTILGVIEKEPDAISFGISFTPKVILFEDSLTQLNLDLSQSRTQYKLYIKQNENGPLTKADIQNLKQFAEDQKLRLDDATDGPNNLIRGLSSVGNFIGIVLSIALFLVVINIITNLVYVLSRFRKTIALLKVYGATSFQIRSIYILLLGCIGAVSGALGSLLGWYATSFGITLIATYAGISITLISGVYVTVLGSLFGMLFIIISAIPFLSSLKKIEPKELLSNQSQRNILKNWRNLRIKDFLAYAPIPLLLVGLIYLVSGDLFLALYSVIACAGLFIFFMAVAYVLLTILYRYKEQFSFTLKSIISFLYLRNFETIITTSSIMTAFCGVFIVAAVSNNITTNLVSNVSKSAPSMYLVDITKTQLPEVKSIIGETFTEYPIVRGRLRTINQKDIALLKNPGLEREFNMTYRDTLIPGEKVVDGVFGAPSEPNKNTVSIDKAFGDELGGVKLGDSLEVFIQGVTLTATITSIREVDSTSGIPFFYLVFPTSVLSTFPASYFGTADLSAEERKPVEAKLASLFPNIIPIDTRVVVETLTSLLGMVVTVVSLVGIPSIILGILLVLVMLYQSLYERSGDVLILRAFGFTKNNVTALFIIESVFLSLLAGVIAYGLAHLVAFFLNIYLFSFTAFSFATLPLFIILGNIAMVCIFSFALSSFLVKTSLKKLLAEK